MSSPRRRIEVAFAVAEDVVCVGIAFLLVAAAGLLLVVAGDEMLEIRDGLGTDPIVEVSPDLCQRWSAFRRSVLTQKSGPSRRCRTSSLVNVASCHVRAEARQGVCRHLTNPDLERQRTRAARWQVRSVRVRWSRLLSGRTGRLRVQHVSASASQQRRRCR